MAVDVEVGEGKQWIEREFWNLLPGKKDKPENKIEWNRDSDRKLHIMRVEVDGKRERREFTDNQVRDSPNDRSQQKRIRETLQNLVRIL